MTRLSISLLGTVQITRDDQPLSDRVYAKVLALFAYLAVESDRPHQRASLAALLWPEHSEERARHSLRQALTTLRHAIDDQDALPPHIFTTRDTVAFNRESDYTLDVEQFMRLLDACERHDHQRLDRCPPCARRLEQALALYRGDFLHGFSVGDSIEFEDWVQRWRQHVQQRVMQALSTVAAWYEQRDELEQASQAVQRQLQLDPWQEPAHRQLMELLWRSGKRAEALNQYTRCRRVLDEELGVEPEAETTALYERIRSSAPGKPPAGSRPVMSAQTYRLPVPENRLVGREREMEGIADLLAHRDCRLLTLIGPGGSGKTRLAIQVARDQAEHFVGGACFVPLDSVRDPDAIIPAIASELGLALPGGADPEQHLLDWLRDRSIFLVLDNAEHLVDGMTLIPGMLGAAPGVKILVTSRERLQLHGEWVFEVGGLGVPDRDVADRHAGYGAVELLADRLRQVRMGAPLDQADGTVMVRICQLVDGMPLAIELAAAWAQSLTLAQIADGIQKNLGFLSTSMRDLPDRHRSIRAVFNQTWEMLSEDEQAAWRRLSMFHDGFLLEAAEQVTGTSPLLLAALVAKSLVTRLPSGRYRVHGLLRQYGMEMLQRDDAEHQRMRDRHCTCYLELLARQEEALIGRDQQAALAIIEQDIENIRMAWTWGMQHFRTQPIGAAVHALWLFYVIRGWMREGATAFGSDLHAMEHAIATDAQASPEGTFTLANSLVRYGGFQSGLGRYDHGIASIARGIALLRELDAQRELGLALNMLAAALRMKGEYEEARTLLQESLDQFRTVGDTWGMAFSLNDLGSVSHTLQDSDEAYQFCDESRTIFRQVGDRRGQAFAASNLGMIASHGGDYERAKRLHREALSLRQQGDDRWGVADSLVQLGSVARQVGARDESRELLLKALGIAWESSVTPVVLDALVELSALHIDEGDGDQARDMLLAITAHPAVHVQVRRRIAELMADVEMRPTVTVDDVPFNRWAVQAVDDLARSLVGS